jgi:hypothetical protein
LPRDTATAWESYSPHFLGDIFPINVIDLWRRHRDKRSCHVLAFEPDKAPGLLPSGTFNLFRGLGIPPEAAVQEDAAAQLVEDHIRTILCSGDKQQGDFMLDWMAHLVQKPGVKMVTTPVLKGGQGSGKGITIQMLGSILGQAHFISAISLESVTGTFQEDKVKTNLLTFLDECTFAGDTKQASILKGLLSENMRKWEAKFINPIRVRNHSNFIVASNYDEIIHVEGDDRRWYCLLVDGRYSGPETAVSRAYFNALGAVDPRAFAWLLYHRDISTFNPREIPATMYGREQKSINFDSSTSFIEHILREKSIQVAEDDARPGVVHALQLTESTMVPRKDLLAAYKLYAKTSPGQRYKPSQGERLLFDKIRKLTNATTNHKPGGRGAQSPGVCFPPLSEARQAFQKAMHEETWEWEE